MTTVYSHDGKLGFLSLGSDYIAGNGFDLPRKIALSDGIPATVDIQATRAGSEAQLPIGRPGPRLAKLSPGDPGRPGYE